MALTYSEKTEKGLHCPDFTLPSVDGKKYALSDFKEARALVILFICNHCPYVQAIEDRIIQLYKELKLKGVEFVGICSNDADSYPEDSKENLYKRWKEKNYEFVYLYDEDQSVAKRFGALCTPDIYAFDSMRKLFYRGRFDDNWQNPSKVKKQELKEALMRILQGQPLNFEPKSSMGCSIKWKK